MIRPVARIKQALVVLGCAAAMQTCLAQPAKPQRIASLGLCTDQIVLLLADRERIVTVNHEANNPAVSYMAAAVGDIPLNQGNAEEIIPLKPDLVLSTNFASPDAVKMLKTLGYRVELLPLPTTVAGIREMLQLAGEWLGEQEKAQALIRNMDKQIADAQQRNAGKPVRRAIIYSPNGYTIGSGTLENDVLLQSGYRNLATEMGVQSFQQISLETLITTAPERIMIDNYAYNQNSLAYSYVNHPVVHHMIPEANRMYVPTRLRDCAGPQVADEITWLADHR
jgi:iron complex transport system substrate-binding protein